MIVKYETASERKEARIRLYKDDVFLIANEVIRGMNLSMPIEDLFATSESFVNFLVKNDIIESEIISWEIDDLKKEIGDIHTYYIVIAISFVKLCALRKTEKKNAESIARSLVVFCNEYDDFSDLLKKFSKKEHARDLDGYRVNLLTYELKTIEKDKPDLTQAKTAIKALVDYCMNMTGDFLEKILAPLMSTNELYDHAFDEDVNRIQEKLGMKTTVQFCPHVEGDFVMNKNVQNQVNGVAAGGTGVVLEKN